MRRQSDIIRMTEKSARDRVFLPFSAVLFIASAVATIHWCRSMAGGGMPMPGGWTMSMMWVKMPGQNWLATASSFTGMWVVMMAAMMLPSLVPSLSTYRRSFRGAESARLGWLTMGWLTMVAGGGYFFVWAVFGAGSYLLGSTVAASEMRWLAIARFVPIASAVVLLLAGCVQLTAWKARQLTHCRDAPACGSVTAGGWSAWRYGIGLGVRCSLCCFGFMMILLVIGVMDLRLMAVLTAAITAERIGPRPELIARVAGVAAIAVGTLLMARALGAG